MHPRTHPSAGRFRSGQCTPLSCPPQRSPESTRMSSIRHLSSSSSRPSIATSATACECSLTSPSAPIGITFPGSYDGSPGIDRIHDILRQLAHRPFPDGVYRERAARSDSSYRHPPGTSTSCSQLKRSRRRRRFSTCRAPTRGGAHRSEQRCIAGPQADTRSSAPSACSRCLKGRIRLDPRPVRRLTPAFLRGLRPSSAARADAGRLSLGRL